MDPYDHCVVSCVPLKLHHICAWDEGVLRLEYMPSTFTSVVIYSLYSKPDHLCVEQDAALLVCL